MYDSLYRSQDNGWWFVGQRRIVFSILDKYIKRKNLEILDAGCGSGSILKHIKKYGKVTGLDISDKALNYCKINNMKLIKGDVKNLKFKENSFDLVFCMDVLQDPRVNDTVALKEIYRILKKDGLLILNLPAFEFLKSTHDIIGNIKHRYNKPEVKDKLEKANFKIKRLTYWNMTLFPFVAIIRWKKRFIKNKDIKMDTEPTNFLANKLLIYILNIESHILKKFNLPYGTSVLSIAKK